MPNHVTTEITGPAEITEKLTRTITPEEIKAYRDETVEVLASARRWGRDERRIAEVSETREKKAAEMAERIIVDFGLLIPQPANIEKDACRIFEHDPGVICWSEWNRGNWGTKWNGYDLEVKRDGDAVTLRFDTAWSHPFPVTKALSVALPGVTLSVSYADEDLGRNLGQFEIRDGKVVKEEAFADFSDEAHEFAAQLKYGKTYAELQAEWADDE